MNYVAYKYIDTAIFLNIIQKQWYILSVIISIYWIYIFCNYNIFFLKIGADPLRARGGLRGGVDDVADGAAPVARRNTEEVLVGEKKTTKNDTEYVIN